MVNFIDAIKNILEENDKTLKDLFDNNIISKNTFYKYRQRYPSLKTLMRISNYLETSIDYIFEFSNENNFAYYNLEKNNFYSNLISLIKSNNISGRAFCKDLSYSRDNLIRWKSGTQPTVRNLIEIAKYFNCTIDELLK